jgi:hypothetical protein
MRTHVRRFQDIFCTPYTDHLWHPSPLAQGNFSPSFIPHTGHELSEEMIDEKFATPRPLKLSTFYDALNTQVSFAFAPLTLAYSLCFQHCF